MAVLHLWQVWCSAGVIFCVIEMFTPAMFFLNLGFACFVAAVAAAMGLAAIYQVITFAVFSAIFLIWLRPLLIKKENRTILKQWKCISAKQQTL